jgi:hypothetical protein
MAPRSSRKLKRMLAFSAVVLLLVVGMFMASVFLPPLTAPAHALNAPTEEIGLSPNSAATAGTLASFTALIPELVTVSLPLIIH